MPIKVRTKQTIDLHFDAADLVGFIKAFEPDEFKEFVEAMPAELIDKIAEVKKTLKK